MGFNINYLNNQTHDFREITENPSFIQYSTLCKIVLKISP